jgi:capsular exopolysaccharide synthesis family protein
MQHGALSGLAFGPWDLLEIVQRRWKWLILGLLSGLALGLSAWYLLPRRYDASITFLVEPQEIPETFVRSTVTLAVQHRVRTLNQRVTSHANLNELIDLVGTERLDPTGELSREEVMVEVRSNLAVWVNAEHNSPVAVVNMRYSSEHQAVVADVVREIANLFIAENRKDRAAQAKSTAEFIDTELARIRRELTEQEDRIREFRMGHLGALPDQLETNVRELDRLTDSLAANLEAQDTLAHEISLIRSNSAGGSGASDGPAGVLAQARQQLLEARRIYTDDHPNVLSLRAQVQRLEAEVAEAVALGTDAETVDPLQARQIETLTFNLATRKKEETKLRERMAEVQARVEEAPRNEQELLALTRGYETMQKTHHLMLGNKHDAALAQNLETAQMAEQFKLLRPARTPSEPSSPNPFLVVPAGVGAGFALAVLAVLMAELRRPAFHSPESLARRLGLPIVAAIPELVCDKIYPDKEPPDDIDWRLVVARAPESAAAEQYRGFLPHLLESESSRIVLVTSAQPGDGKSLTCANLACVVARDLGRRVLLIDADMRRATQHQMMKAERKPGLSDILKGSVDLAVCAQNVLPNLHLLPAGGPASNPLALLNGEAFFKLVEQARENYEVVFIDSPPILPVIDAKILRRLADMVVFVVQAGSTPSGGVTRSLAELKGAAGVVFNRVSTGSFRRYYYYDAYSHYGYSGPHSGADGDRASKRNLEKGAGGR